jgi:hypothetical protein
MQYPDAMVISCSVSVPLERASPLMLLPRHFVKSLEKTKLPDVPVSGFVAVKLPEIAASPVIFKPESIDIFLELTGIILSV